MASATRATGVAPRVSSRVGSSSRTLATMFKSADTKALGDAMVAAAAKFGPKHQAEVKAALSEDVPSSERRNFIKKAIAGVSHHSFRRVVRRVVSRVEMKEREGGVATRPIRTLSHSAKSTERVSCESRVAVG